MLTPGKTRLGSWARVAIAEAAVVTLFVGLAVVYTWPLASDLSGQTLIGPDPMHHLWSVHWISSHLVEPSRVFHGNIYHPSPYSVLYIDPNLGTVVLVAPLRLLIHDPVPLFNVAVLLALAFSGWAFHTLVRQLTGSRWAGLTTGILATFCSHQMAHVFHMNLISVGWMPLFWLGLGRLLHKPGWGNVTLAGVSFALAAQSSGYYAVISAVVALVFAAWHWRRLRDPCVLLSAAAAAALALALMTPYLIGFTTLREYAGISRDIELSAKMAFNPGSDLGSRSYLYRSLGGQGGQQMFPGLLTLSLAVVALMRRRQHSRLYLVVTLALLVLSFGPQLDLGGLSIPLPYRALFAIPLLDSMRHPYTFAAVAMFTLAVLAGLGCAVLARGLRGWLGPLMVLLAVAETLGPGPALRKIPRGMPGAYQLLRTLPPGPALDLSSRPHVIIWTARYGGPMVNGAGPFGPLYHITLRRQVRNHWLRRVPEDIDTSKPMSLLGERIPVRYVIVPVGRVPTLWRLAESFDRSRRFTLVGQASNRDRVYELDRAER